MIQSLYKKVQPKIMPIFIPSNTIKAFSLLILAVLILMPFSMDKMDLFDVEKTSAMLYPLTVLFSGIIKPGVNFFYISSYFLFLLPAVFVAVLVSFFKKINKQLLYIALLTAITFYLLASVAGMVLFANTIRWFLSLSPFTYIAFFSAFGFHIFLIANGIIFLKTQDANYMEYRNILIEDEKKKKLNRQYSVSKEKKENIGILERLKKHIVKLKIKKTHIKTKITIVFILTILIILSTFVYTDLRNYRVLLTQNVNTTGINQAEQVSAIYYFSDGLHAKISAFLEGIKKTNDSSPFPCQRVDIITTSSKDIVFIDKVTSPQDVPLFDVFSYTTSAGSVRKIPSDEKQITPHEAFDYIQHFRNEHKRSEPIYKPEKGTCLYIYPILISKKEGQRLIGFSVVTYLKEILDRPYFQVKVFVFSISVFFFYTSIIITLFLADFIANPIILLSGSIRKTTNAFKDMLSGTAKIEADKLIFRDGVKTNDEIKNLSLEIKNIVSLVRGIVPYISFHTLQNAEKNINNRSYLRDLCFLFTDIRGFTTLCENMSAKDVTSLLNRYLDIETKIIFDNGGDVDKYVGDEIMAFFSGPKKEINACKAAMEIRTAMRQAQKEAIESGSAVVSIGIGISSGKVVFGPVGSKTRKDFTSIGDIVNLAARLEGANKEYGSKSIISESVYKNLSKDFICRELDYIAVKGKTEAVRIFEILQPTEKLTEKKLYDIKHLFETGLMYYRNRNWKAAEEYFTSCIEKYNDAPSKVFLNRTLHYKVTPPKSNWQGVFRMSVK